MKKVVDLAVRANNHISENYVLLRLSPLNDEILPDMIPGQFVNIAVDGSKTTFLRRPISINRVSSDKRELDLLIRIAGDGTKALSEVKPGDNLNVVLPLGNGFPMNDVKGKRMLLIGGGVGVAPLMCYGECLLHEGAFPEFLLGARTKADLLLIDEFDAIAQTHVMTEDGSVGEKGLVTQHPVLESDNYDAWVCCGPVPMMKAIAAKARQKDVECFVSLENMMACGVGACLCCVEKTVRGNVCVCTEGPVFNIKDLTW